MQQYNDYPFADIEVAVNDLISNGHTIHQKYTCQHCGARQTMEEPNTLFRSGMCQECNQVTIIKNCNYLAILKVAR